MVVIVRHVARVAAGLTLLLALAAELVEAQGTTLKIQAAWPPTSMLWENSKFFAERVGKLSGDRLKIEMLASGAVVPPFESLDATGRGVLDGTHAAPAYWVGKNKAAALFGPTPGGLSAWTCWITLAGSTKGVGSNCIASSITIF